MLTAQFGQVGARLQRLTQQDGPAGLQQAQCPDGPLAGGQGAVGKGESGGVRGQSVELADGVLLVVPLQPTRHHARQQQNGFSQQVGRRRPRRRRLKPRPLARRHDPRGRRKLLPCGGGGQQPHRGRAIRAGSARFQCGSEQGHAGDLKRRYRETAPSLPEALDGLVQVRRVRLLLEAGLEGDAEVEQSRAQFPVPGRGRDRCQGLASGADGIFQVGRPTLRPVAHHQQLGQVPQQQKARRIAFRTGGQSCPAHRDGRVQAGRLKRPLREKGLREREVGHTLGLLGKVLGGGRRCLTEFDRLLRVRQGLDELRPEAQPQRQAAPDVGLGGVAGREVGQCPPGHVDRGVHPLQVTSLRRRDQQRHREIPAVARRVDGIRRGGERLPYQLRVARLIRRHRRLEEALRQGHCQAVHQLGALVLARGRTFQRPLVGADRGVQALQVAPQIEPVLQCRRVALPPSRPPQIVVGPQVGGLLPELAAELAVDLRRVVLALGILLEHVRQAPQLIGEAGSVPVTGVGRERDVRRTPCRLDGRVEVRCGLRARVPEPQGVAQTAQGDGALGIVGGHDRRRALEGVDRRVQGVRVLVEPVEAGQGGAQVVEVGRQVVVIGRGGVDDQLPVGGRGRQAVRVGSLLALLGQHRCMKRGADEDPRHH
ncbi:hypothetical protein [Streptomyces rubiginosohelvolus]|uniref:hypothetical protein n=1 Tax=Streptomyces rubiginosohelvolus TaxID=67362 RepID=UPI0035E25FFA